MTDNLGIMVEHHRIKANLTQRELAQRLDVDFTYISKIENGKLGTAPSRELLASMAAELGLEPNYLYILAGAIDTKRLKERARESIETATLLILIENALTDDRIEWLIELIGDVMNEEVERASE
jgi:transcriptional regulator with XRE-family HTH domain